MGASLFFGGMMELIGIVFESRLPDELQSSLRILHATSLVRALVLCVGSGSIIIGVGMLGSIWGVWRGDMRSLARLRLSAWSLLSLLCAAQIVLSFTLYPHLDRLAPPPPFPGFWLVTMIGSAVPPALLAGLILLYTRPAAGSPSA